METQRIVYLYQQYLQGKASPEELEQWEKIIHDPLLKESLNKIIDQSYYQISEEDILNLDGKRSEEIYNYIISHPSDRKPLTQKLWIKVIIAAAIATMIASAGIWFFNTGGPEVNPGARVAVNDVAPGKQGATLTLANGQKIHLTDAANGELAKQSGVVVSKSADGQLVYEIQQRDKGNTNQINTLTTAKGETYRLRLPDGSLVWLNAASSLTYSATLKERGVRRVRLEGEGYFEIAKDKAHPFIVSTSKQDVEVLGTHFNVYSYADEPISKTTLLEGSVKVNSSTIIKPGEQASNSTTGKIEVSEVDVDKVVAWKNGRFVFDNENIESIMRKLARWYNVEVIYQDDVRDIPFTAFISKYDNISKILDKITYTQNIHFKIEGRRVTVMR